MTPFTTHAWSGGHSLRAVLAKALGGRPSFLFPRHRPGKGGKSGIRRHTGHGGQVSFQTIYSDSKPRVLQQTTGMTPVLAVTACRS